jgi:hypothetical protein
MYEMNVIDASIAPIDLEYLQLSRKTTNNQKAACNSLIDLHDASNVILTSLEANFSLVF